MQALNIMTQAIFWGSIATVAYAYVGYPFLLAVGARCFAKKKPSEFAAPTAPGDWPMVSLIIAAYREESVILQRIENALRMDYPADRLEILIGCDGNEDATGELVHTVNDSRVRLMQFAERRGKPSVLNDCVAAAQGEILAFSDANTFWEPNALKQIVRHFRHATIGGVCGQLVLTDPETGDNVDGAYWRYENFLKRNEGRIGGLLGFNGAIYAIRSECWTPIPAKCLIDDFLIGMRVHLTGQQLEFEESAIAHEETAPSQAAEFHRRARIGAGGFQSLVWLAPLLNPKYGAVAFAFWSHKMARWFCPLFLMLAVIANGALLNIPIYRVTFAAQILFYGVALMGRFLPGQSRGSRLLRLGSLFVGMNVALAVGFWRWLRSSQSGTWKRTERVATHQPSNASAEAEAPQLVSHR